MHTYSHLFEIVILLCAAVVIVAAFRTIRLSPVLGYLVAGTMIGPYGFGLIEDVKSMGSFAEFGIILLLFLIGLELSINRLVSMRSYVFGFGTAQVALTASLIGLFIYAYTHNYTTAVIIAGGLALSSTAIVLQVVSEQGEKASQVGRLSLAILLLQDIVVIPLLIFISVAADNNLVVTDVVFDITLKVAICLAIIVVVGRYLLRPFFRFIASLDHTELFTATTLFIVLGVAALTTYAGLSPALGAFLAGLLIAETEFKPQVEADILPFKGLFLGLFFMTVGMSLDIQMLLENFASIIGATIALMGTKALIILLLCRCFDIGVGTAIHAGLLLSQGSEFAFVLFTLAGNQGLLDPFTMQILLVVITISMALTPFLADLGKELGDRLQRKTAGHTGDMIEETLDLRSHVIICGFGRVGHTVARLLENENINYAAIDTDSFLVAKERKAGIPVYYGDSARMHVLGALGINRARAVIITHNDIRLALQTIQVVREINPDLPIIARAKNIEQVQKLEKAGANLAVAEMFEVSLQMGGALLKALAINEYEISRIIDMFRAEDYMLTRSAERESTAS